MEIINNYKKAESELFEHVGFTPLWNIHPINLDYFNNYWKVYKDYVIYSTNRRYIENTTNDYYFDDDEYTSEDDCSIDFTTHRIDELCTLGFSSDGIYRGEMFTMLACVSKSGDKWFKFFDNKLEII